MEMKATGYVEVDPADGKDSESDYQEEYVEVNKPNTSRGGGMIKGKKVRQWWLWWWLWWWCRVRGESTQY